MLRYTDIDLRNTNCGDVLALDATMGKSIVNDFVVSQLHDPAAIQPLPPILKL